MNDTPTEQINAEDCYEMVNDIMTSAMEGGCELTNREKHHVALLIIASTLDLSNGKSSHSLEGICSDMAISSSKIRGYFNNAKN